MAFGSISSSLGGGLGGLGSGGMTVRQYLDLIERRNRDPLEGMSEANILEALGAPQEEVDRARLYQQTALPGGVGYAGQVLGVTPEPERGLLTNLYDYMTRGQSAIVGGISGLSGLERRRETRTETGEIDGAMAANAPMYVPEGTDRNKLALERFMQGIKGEEKFQSADFGALAYDRESTPFAERALKTTIGFALDVGLDPTTYVGGAGLYGRVVGSTLVKSGVKKAAPAAIAKLDDAAKVGLVRDAILRLGIDDAALTVSARTVEELARRAAIEAGEDVSRVAVRTGLLTTEDALARIAKNPAILDDVAAEAVSAAAAMGYRIGSSGATYQYLRGALGDEGVDIFRGLAGELQGGMRFRVPLTRWFNENRLPTVLRLPGTGTGAIGRVGFGDVTISGISNMARSQLRSNRFFRPLDAFGGATGRTGRRMAEAGYRRWSDISKGTYQDVLGKASTVKVRGRDVPVVSWGNWNNLDEMLRLYRIGSMGAMREVIGNAAAAQDFDAKGAKLGQEYIEAFEQAIRKNNLATESGDPGRTMSDIYDLKGGRPTDAQIYAYEAATHYQMTLETMKQKLMNLSDADAGFSVGIIEDYWPRIADDLEKAFGGAGQLRTSNLRERKQFIAELSKDGSVMRFMTPNEIAEQTGEDVFIREPQKLMVTYLNSINRIISDETLFQAMLDKGVLFRGGADAYRERLNVGTAARSWVQAVNKLRSGAAELATIGQAGPLRTSGLSAQELGAEAVQAERVLDALALTGARIHRRRMYENYEKVEGADVWRSIDGTEIGVIDGVFRVSRPRKAGRVFLQADGNWGDEAVAFTSRDEARRAADISLAGRRDRSFIRDVERLRERVLRDVVGSLKVERDLADRGMNVLEPGNIPATMQEEFFQALSDIIYRYGSREGLTSKLVRADAYRSADYGAGAGGNYRLLTQGSENGPRIRDYWYDRMEQMGIFAPEGLVDDVTNIFKAVDNPKRFERWVMDWYDPFYATQKAYMTSLRGPGYHVRNIAGGLWNAYLVGVTRKHWVLAGRIKEAEYEARRRGIKAAPDDLRAQSLVTIDAFREIMIERFGEKRGQELIDLWNLFDARGLGGRTIGAKQRGIVYTPGPGGITGDIDIMKSDLDLNWMQRVRDVATEKNRWATAMNRSASESEDFLRLGTFLRGVEMYGTEDGGRAAGALVKASQFDYSDLSPEEAGVIKRIMTFYTWARNNIPLQLRAIIAEPSRVSKALRLNSALGDVFGEPEDPSEPLPAYARDRFGWRVREDMARGPKGDAMAMGIIVGEPLADANRLFRSGGRVFNMNALLEQFNPLIGVTADAIRGVERSTGGTPAPEEEVPRILSWIPGLGRETPEGERVMSTGVSRAIRDIVIPLGLVERYAAPLLGNDRLQRRWYSSLVSGIMGLPLSTLDDYQTGGELRTRANKQRAALKRELGEDYDLYVGYVNRALELGVTPEEMQFIMDGILEADKITDVPVDRLDQNLMVDTIRFLRRRQRLIDAGVSQDIIEMMERNFRPRTDMEEGVRAGRLQAVTDEQLAALGVSRTEVSQMDAQERENLLRRWLETQ